MDLTLVAINEDTLVLYQQPQDGVPGKTRTVLKDLGIKVLALNGLLKVKMLLSPQPRILPQETQKITTKSLKITKYQMLFLLESVKVSKQYPFDEHYINTYLLFNSFLQLIIQDLRCKKN